MSLAKQFVRYFTKIFMKLPTYICNLDTDFKFKVKIFINTYQFDYIRVGTMFLNID